jgi:hypothetical protein
MKIKYISIPRQKKNQFFFIYKSMIEKKNVKYWEIQMSFMEFLHN